MLGWVMASLGCPSEPTTPDRPAELEEPLVLEGWPGPLRPVLDPKEGVVVRLRAEPRPDAEATAKCVLPPTAPVNWSRSRVRVDRPGILRANSEVSLSAVGFEKLEGLKPEDVADFGPNLKLEAGEGRVMMVRFGGRCLLEDGKGWQAVDCSSPRVELVHPPVQSWWLEMGCSNGEGWFQVDEAKFEIEHYLE